MKTGLVFREQVQFLNTWFQQWNECEQIIAIYSLLTKTTVTQTKFLAYVLEQSLQRIWDCTELHLMDQEANNPEYVQSLGNETKEAAISRLLTHLPLLRPDNEQAKSQYLTLLPKILQHSLENGVHIEESRQLLSYSIIHPATSSDDRRALNGWLRLLEERLLVDTYNRTSYGGGQWRTDPGSNGGVNESTDQHTTGSNLNNGHTLLQATNSAPGGPLNPVPSSQANNSFYHARVRRSNSLTPPVTNPSSEWISQEDIRSKQRSMSLSSDHAPLSPQSSLASSGSGSEILLDEPKNSFNTQGSGMRDVPSWLKSLRLHRYSYLFSAMTYDEMLHLSEDQLEQQNVTKGARHKIVLSVQKLKERQITLKSMERDVMEGGGLKATLSELKSMIMTPLKAFEPSNETVGNLGQNVGGDVDPAGIIPEGDLCSQFTRLMGKICTQLLVTNRPEDDNFNTFFMLIEKCLNHEAFTPQQKKRLFSWKQQIQKVWQPLPMRRGLDGRLTRRWSANTYGTTFGNDLGLLNVVGSTNSGLVTAGSVARRRSFSSQFVKPRPICPQKPVSFLTQAPPTIQRCPVSSNVIGYNRPTGQEMQMRSHLAVQRTKSAPTQQFNFTGCETDPDLTTRLENLCVSMTEHALGGQAEYLDTGTTF